MAVEQFLDRLSKQALEMRESNNVAGLNALTADPSIRDYVNNVVFNPAMSQSQYQYWYKDKWAHLKLMAEQYEQAEQAKAKVETLEDKLDKLARKFDALLEQQTAKQKKAVAEAEAAAEQAEDTDDDNAQTDEKPDEDDAEAETPPADEAEGDKPEDEAD